MHQVLRKLFLAACLLVAAFFANYFGYISVPWLDIDTVPVYGDKADSTEEAVKQALSVEKADQLE